MSLTLVSSSEDDIGSAPTTKLSTTRPHPGREVMNSAMEEVVVCEAYGSFGLKTIKMPDTKSGHME